MVFATVTDASGSPSSSFSSPSSSSSASLAAAAAAAPSGAIPALPHPPFFGTTALLSGGSTGGGGKRRKKAAAPRPGALLRGQHAADVLRLRGMLRGALGSARGVLCIHNLAFQGVFPEVRGMVSHCQKWLQPAGNSPFSRKLFQPVGSSSSSGKWFHIAEPSCQPVVPHFVSRSQCSSSSGPFRGNFHEGIFPEGDFLEGIFPESLYIQ